MSGNGETRPPGKVVSRTILLTFPSAEQALVVEIDIACPNCGTGTLIVPGEHIATVLDILQTAMQAHPALCGTVGTKLPPMSFTMRGPSGPQES